MYRGEINDKSNLCHVRGHCRGRGVMYTDGCEVTNMSDGMISSLPTKLDVISRTHENVLDFQVTHARLWNKSKHTKRERRLFSKTCDWNNVEVARKNGYMWCAQCEDKGFIYCLRGIIRCNCAATGYEEIRRLKFKTLKLSQEVKQACQNTSK